MEIDNKISTELKPLVSRIGEMDDFQYNKDDEVVTFFFSFDIVNSTKYKTKNKGKWAYAISEILRHIISEFANSPSRGFQFWKTLGDEIIYTKNIGTLDEVYDTLDEVYKNMVTLNEKIDKGIICDIESGKMLSIKATAWIAAISDDCLYTDNIYTEYQINDNRKQVEYIGPDIDTGFRTSSYSMKNRLVISFALASLLRNYYNIQKKLNISLSKNYEEMFLKVNLVTFKALKGVWNELPYPIFMYHGDDTISFIDSLSEETSDKKNVFDEYLCSMKSRKNISQTGYTSYEEYIIDYLTKEHGYQQKIERIVKIIHKNYKNTLIDLKPLTKIHSSFLCYFMDEKQLKIILCKNNQEDQWGFGGLEMYYSFGYLREIEEYYDDTYNLNCSFLINNHYHSQTPVCLHRYDHVEKCLNNVIKGYTYLAEVNDVHYQSIASNPLLKIIDVDVLFDYIDNLDEQIINKINLNVKRGKILK